MISSRQDIELCFLGAMLKIRLVANSVSEVFSLEHVAAFAASEYVKCSRRGKTVCRLVDLSPFIGFGGYG